MFYVMYMEALEILESETALMQTSSRTLRGTISNYQ